MLGPQTHGEVPIAQRVGRMRLRPGSGFLAVQVTTDGPTRVLQILDMNERVCIKQNLINKFKKSDNNIYTKIVYCFVEKTVRTFGGARLVEHRRGTASEPNVDQWQLY